MVPKDYLLDADENICCSGATFWTVTKLDQAIVATDDPVKQNVLISQQNKLLSYMNGLSIGVGSTDQVLLKKMRGIGKRR